MPSSTLKFSMYQKIAKTIVETKPVELVAVRWLRLINEKAYNQRSWLQAFVNYKCGTLLPN